jgi:DNA-binding response OmpR family regulator
MCTILAISHDEALLASRASLLRKTNAEVIGAKASEAENILKAQQFDLIVLCHSLTPAETLEIASLAHQPIIAIPVLKIVSDIESASESILIAPDVVTSCDPKVLVEKVTEFLDVSLSGCH